MTTPLPPLQYTELYCSQANYITVQMNVNLRPIIICISYRDSKQEYE